MLISLKVDGPRCGLPAGIGIVATNRGRRVWCTLLTTWCEPTTTSRDAHCQTQVGSEVTESTETMWMWVARFFWLCTDFRTLFSKVVRLSIDFATFFSKVVFLSIGFATFFSKVVCKCIGFATFPFQLISVAFGLDGLHRGIFLPLRGHVGLLG